MRISDWSSDVCSSDLQILVAGELKSGVVASVRLSGASSPGTGIRLEINGDDGDLVITAAAGGRGILMSDLRLQKTVGMAELIDVEVPDSYLTVPPSIRQGQPRYVGSASKIGGASCRERGVQ